MYSYHGRQARVLLQRHLPTSQSKLLSGAKGFGKSLPCGRSVCGHFKPRTVKRRKVWQEIENRLNENRLIHFRVTKRSTREYFSLLLEKFKAKRKNEVKQSGVDVQDSELDVAMEVEKWQEAESQDGTCESKTKQVGE